MTLKKLWVPGTAAAAAALLAIGSLATADPASDSQPVNRAEFQLPPGWTPDDMQACIAAGTPGKMHKRLTDGIGTWHGKTTMWMYPDSEPLTSECTCKVTEFMDGRYVKVEMGGEMPGMGPYRGFGVYGYDNVAQRFDSAWVDSHSTSMGRGEGTLSDDGKVLTWTYTVSCPVTKKPTKLREVETITTDDAKTLEMFGKDPKSGKEFKMMSIELTRKS